MANEIEVLKVGTDALRNDATIWPAQAGPLGEIIGIADTVQFGALQGTIYYPYMEAYRNVWTFVRGRCAEGAQAFTSIGRTLDEVARIYDEVTSELERRR